MLTLFSVKSINNTPGYVSRLSVKEHSLLTGYTKVYLVFLDKVLKAHGKTCNSL